LIVHIDSERTGILVLGTVNYFPTFHYAFFCAPQLRNLYIALMSISGSGKFATGTNAMVVMD
jgi:hypothetical protein